VVQAWKHRNAKGDTVELRNFIGRFNPAAARRLLFYAHWDTKPTADYDSGAKAKLPVPGANDGASGVAVLLAMADALKKRAPTIGVDLLMVDGEDYGTFTPEVDVLLGAKYYAANQVAGPKPEYAVLLDMVGGKASQFRKEGYSLTAAPAVVELVWGTAGRLGLGNIFLNESGGSSTDDHIPLQQVGIRAVDVIAEYGPSSSYPSWHTTEDTVDKLSAETLKAVGDVMVALVREAKKLP
jgi:Zn-dependent M28 family amino/carboxypeptidase